jgi:hypothetical protein
VKKRRSRTTQNHDLPWYDKASCTDGNGLLWDSDWHVLLKLTIKEPIVLTLTVPVQQVFVILAAITRADAFTSDSKEAEGP